MLDQITGLHHVTSMAADAQASDDFFTRLLGLRRVKKTVNFDDPATYHLYYGDEAGTPGTVMTIFPFRNLAPGRRGAGEVAETGFAVPEGALPWWRDWLQRHGVAGLGAEERLGQRRLRFAGPDGDGFALVEAPGDARTPFAGPVPQDRGIHGFHGVTLRLRDMAATAGLLRLMGYEEAGREAGLTRFLRRGGNGADVVDIEERPGDSRARSGAGSVHHVAFSVPNLAAQAQVRAALLEAGQQVTPAIDRDYFHAIYFRTPGGVLFEVATEGPGFDRDEERAHLGQALRIPAQHAHLRPRIEAGLPPLR